MDIKIKACPFCGNPGDQVSLWVRGGYKHSKFCYVECDVCGAKTKAFTYSSYSKEINFHDLGAERAYDAWNRRAE